MPSTGAARVDARARVSATRYVSLDPYDYAEVRRLAAELELAEPVAITLVRRGYRTVDAARRFLEARESHDPSEFRGMEEACELILSVARRPGRITVHGDYDVDGVCSTAILVSTLRELGAECDWLIPDRLADGYGLSASSVEQLRRRSSDLVITADCGIGSVEEVAAARGAGIEVVVTDHHLPGERLPDCPIVHPVVSDYPFEGLCAAGVAYKLATALWDAAGRGAVETVEAAATRPTGTLTWSPLPRSPTWSPWWGEPAPGARGIARPARLPAPGPPGPDGRRSGRSADRRRAGARLPPRAPHQRRRPPLSSRRGRRVDADDRCRSRRRDRRRARQGERGAALGRAAGGGGRRAARSALPDSLRDAPALVLAGEGWHPGVVGIAASRLAERHFRPTVLLSVDGERAKGSARSIPGFDLVAALDACSEHLTRYGGHRAAAGLELEGGRLEPFREAFIAHAAAAIDPEELVRMERLDALVGVGREGIGMDLARQLESLGPFGMGNPGPRLLVPSGRLREVRPLGEEGKHSRFQLESGAGRALGVAFGMNGEITRREDQLLDLSVELEVDRWNGAEQPRVVVRELYPLDAGEAEASACGEGCPAEDAGWWERLQRELAALDAGRPGCLLEMRGPEGARREVVDRTGGAAVASLAELISSGEPVLAICADAARRSRLASWAADPRRFGVALPRIACCRCGAGSLDAALAQPPATGLVLADWTALAQLPGAARRFRQVVLIDPPPSEALDALGSTAAAAGAYLHLCWGPAELELTERLLTRDWELRAPIGEIWRGLAEAGGEAEGAALRVVLEGSGGYARTPEVAARCVRVLAELDLCEWLPDRGNPILRVLSSERTDLGRSRAYGACLARHQEAVRFLRSRAQPT